MNQYQINRARKDAGFSLIEIMIVVAILGIIMTAAISSFIQTMRHSAHQSNIATTKIETGAGLELLRSDLEHAGFGLPWQFLSPPNPYTEPGPMADTPNVPRALISQDNYAAAPTINAADYLVIRATNVAQGVAGQRWGYVGRNAARNVAVQSMSSDPFIAGDRVIVIRPQSSPGQFRQLLTNANPTNNYVTRATDALMDATLAPMATANDPNGEKYLVYGLNDDAGISRPFNRTDYYISGNAALPTHCAPGTGVLVKAVLNQADNTFRVLPIVDCVADFQIVYYLDTNNDGGWDQRADADGLNNLPTDQIRDRVKAVHCYILAHEGGLDSTYTHTTANMNVGEVNAAGTTLLANAGRQFALNGPPIGGNWANYRWKVYSLVVTPQNLN